MLAALRPCLVAIPLLFLGCGSPTISPSTEVASAETAPPVASSAAPISVRSAAPTAASLANDVFPAVLGCLKQSRDPSFKGPPCDDVTSFMLSRDPRLSTPEADQLLFDWLTSNDPDRVAVAALRWPVHPELLPWDSEKTSRLFVLLQKDDPTVPVNAVVRWITALDLEKLGLGDQVRGLAKVPNAHVREEVAVFLLTSQRGAVLLETVRSMLQDADPKVRKAAAKGLIEAGPTDAENCGALEKIARAGGPDFAQVLREFGYVHACPGVQPIVLQYIEAQTRDVTKLAPTAADETYGQALLGICNDGAGQHVSDAVKKQAGRIAERLVSTKDPISRQRETAVWPLAQCDPEAAKRVLPRLLQDKDERVVSEVQLRLGALK